ncbi:MAG: HNH endonuclease [Actinobacteria bacterium]|nr:HNH endonuclease [Actinomycetota bacterium]
MRPDPKNLPEQLRRTEPQRRHDALIALADQVGPTLTDPNGRGTRPAHVLLLAHLDALRGDPNAPTPTLDNGEPIPSAIARALTCDPVAASIILDAAGTPIWGSAYTRVIPAHLRRAVQARDLRCRRCGAPLAQCEVHHILHVLDGGPTEERNLLLLCWACHDDIHTGHWTLQLHDDNSVTFTSPQGQSWNDHPLDPTPPPSGEGRRSTPTDDLIEGGWSQGRPDP